MGSYPALQSGPALSPRTDVPWCRSQKGVSSQMSHDAILRRFPHRCPMMLFSEGGFLTDVPWCHSQKEVSSQMSHDAVLRRRFPQLLPVHPPITNPSLAVVTMIPTAMHLFNKHLSMLLLGSTVLGAVGQAGKVGRGTGQWEKPRTRVGGDRQDTVLTPPLWDDHRCVLVKKAPDKKVQPSKTISEKGDS